MKFREMPIRRKLTLIILTTSFTAMLLLSVTFLAYEFVSFRRATVHQLATVGEITAANCTAALAFDNPSDAGEILSALRAERHIVAACLYDKSGLIFSRYPKGILDSALPTSPGSDGYRFEEPYLVGYEPVAQGGNDRLGTLFIKFDTGPVMAKWLKTFLESGLAVIALVLLVAYLMSHTLQRQISDPILALAETAGAISARHDYSVRAKTPAGGEIGQLTSAFNEMLAQIQELNRGLEQRVTDRTAQLEAANKELEAFSYSVSHDLRAPLRHIDGFAGLLAKNSARSLDENGRRYLATISGAAKRMGRLIDDLLSFSRTGRSELNCTLVDQDALVAAVLRDGRFEQSGRPIDWQIAPLPLVRADAAMLRQVWSNLLENAVKYSGNTERPRVEIGASVDAKSGEHLFFVRDNGVGFDMQYVDKLFGVFQRLHSVSEFEGTGIGLANVRRIIARHGGRTWAEGAVGKGATFFFSLRKAGNAPDASDPPAEGSPSEAFSTN
jgi:signal transduction histidine kinase